MSTVLCNTGPRAITINPIKGRLDNVVGLVVRIDGPLSKRIAVLCDYECEYVHKGRFWGDQSHDIMAALNNKADTVSQDGTEFKFDVWQFSITRFEPDECAYNFPCYIMEINEELRVVFWGGTIFNAAG